MPVINEAAIVTFTADGEDPVEIPVFSSGAAESIGCEFITKFFDLADYAEGLDPETLKRLDSVVFDVQTENKPEFLTVSVGSKENINDTPTWTDFEDVAPGEPLYLRLPKARFIALWVKDNGPAVDYEISRITIFGTVTKGTRK